MSVSRIRLLILVLVLVGVVIFVVQNLEPVSLVFFKTRIPLNLPLALWILLFTAAGALTSALLQFLNNLQRQATPEGFYTSEPKPYQPSSRRRATSQSRSSRSDYMRSPTSNTTTAAEPDWKPREDEEDWNIEEPPTEPTTTGEIFDRPLKEDQSKSYEVQQEPKTASRSGSVYSYSYREPKDTAVNKTEQVYDANYRVIRPPYKKNADKKTEEDDSEEDWI